MPKELQAETHEEEFPTPFGSCGFKLTHYYQIQPLDGVNARKIRVLP
jgi:hypothetical protein